MCMNLSKVYLPLLVVLSLFTACTEDEIPSTGEVTISIDNQSLFNQDNYFVEAGIVIFESDQQSLVGFGRHDISKGGNVTFDPVTLNAGNYYVRYRFYLGNSQSGSTRHKPFQVQAGVAMEVKIIH